MIEMLQVNIPISFLCRFFGVSRSGFYSWKKRNTAPGIPQKTLLCQKIREVFRYSKGTYGSPRITAELNANNIKISENTVTKYMKELGLDARLKKKFKVVTTDSNHDGPIAERIFKTEEELPRRPSKILAGDITYIKIPGGFMYLSIVMDLYNREILGWSLDDNLTKKGVIKALDLAMRESSPDAQIIFHSDRGSQYASEAFRKLLRNMNGIPSMSRKGNCYDNCYVESWFKSLKNEWIYRNKIVSKFHLRKLIFEYIDGWYNTKRRHSSLDNMSPKEYKVLNAAA